MASSFQVCFSGPSFCMHKSSLHSRPCGFQALSSCTTVHAVHGVLLVCVLTCMTSPCVCLVFFSSFSDVHAVIIYTRYVYTKQTIPFLCLLSWLKLLCLDHDFVEMSSGLECSSNIYISISM